MTSPLAAETELLKQDYVAFNRNELPAAVAQLDPQIEWTEPAEFPGGGTYHGQTGVQTYLSQSRADWAEGNGEPEQVTRSLCLVHVRVRLKDSTEWHETRFPMSSPFVTANPFRCMHLPTGGKPSNGLESKTQM